MKKFLLLLLVVSFLLIHCSQKKSRVVATQRDTTITKANAFSELFLDSTRLEQFVTEHKMEDSAANLLRNFYNSRNYQFAWFTKDGLAEQGRAFWNLYNNYINFSKDSSLIDKRLHQQMELLLNEDSVINPATDAITETELQLTEHFFKYAQYAYAGKVNPEQLQWHIPRKKVDVSVLLDSLVAGKGKDIDNWEPVNQQYKLLKKELTRYYQIQKSGAWGDIILGKNGKYKQTQIKIRLLATGDYAEHDSSKRSNLAFKSAVQQAQKRFGLKEDGVVNTALVKELNVPIEDRIEQLLINMERMRWLPKNPAGNRLVANIPEFKLHVFEDSKKIFDMDIVVGKAANSTVVFNDMLKYVVFSPYWNIPRSIVKNEILPGMEKNANYLAERNMEQTGYSNGLPVIRQKPGGANALGKVKFIFPNSYNIYFHDTPSRSLFNSEKRAFSHGCIRLSEPEKMAEYLLRNQPEWTPDKINEAMNASKEKWVTLKEPVPVFITYFTTWVDSEGLLNFRDDIYGHDKKMSDYLFEHNK